MASYTDADVALLVQMARQILVGPNVVTAAALEVALAKFDGVPAELPKTNYARLFVALEVLRPHLEGGDYLGIYESPAAAICEVLDSHYPKVGTQA